MKTTQQWGTIRGGLKPVIYLSLVLRCPTADMISASSKAQRAKARQMKLLPLAVAGRGRGHGSRDGRGNDFLCFASTCCLVIHCPLPVAGTLNCLSPGMGGCMNELERSCECSSWIAQSHQIIKSPMLNVWIGWTGIFVVVVVVTLSVWLMYPHLRSTSSALMSLSLSSSMAIARV